MTEDEGSAKETIDWQVIKEDLKQQGKPEEKAAAEVPAAPVDNEKDDAWKDLVIEQKRQEDKVEDKYAANVGTQTEIVMDTEGKYQSLAEQREKWNELKS